MKESRLRRMRKKKLAQRRKLKPRRRQYWLRRWTLVARESEGAEAIRRGITRRQVRLDRQSRLKKGAQP